MDVSIFLAKVLGLYLVIVSISLLLNIKTYRAAMKEMVSNSAILIISGILALIVGLLLVISHNLWDMNWRVVITIFAWLCLIKGVIRISFPKTADNLINKFIKSNRAYYVSVAIAFAAGLFLCYCGFFLYQ